MFIVCSNCDFKYLVNSADLKPTGRMVECANCGHQWFQNFSEDDGNEWATVPKNTTIPEYSDIGSTVVKHTYRPFGNGGEQYYTIEQLNFDWSKSQLQEHRI